MEIETYEINEVSSEGTDPLDAEAVALCEELGLQGQMSLVRGGDDGERRIMPYRKMTDEEGRVFAELFPRKTPVERFDAEPIPTRVLQVIAHAREMFDRIDVWHVGEQVVADPLLVGVVTERHYQMAIDRGNYLLARWGDALASFDVLRESAVANARKRWSEGMAKAKRQAESIASMLDEIDGVQLCDSRPPEVELPHRFTF